MAVVTYKKALEMQKQGKKVLIVFPSYFPNGKAKYKPFGYIEPSYIKSTR